MRPQLSAVTEIGGQGLTAVLCSDVVQHMLAAGPEDPKLQVTGSIYLLAHEIAILSSAQGIPALKLVLPLCLIVCLEPVKTAYIRFHIMQLKHDR